MYSVQFDQVRLKSQSLSIWSDIRRVDKLVALIVHNLGGVPASCADTVEECDVLLGGLAFVPGALILVGACWAGHVCSYTEVV